MTNKILISRKEVEGNLNDLNQIYEINYLEREGNLTDKVEIAIMLERKNGDNYAYRSLRFNSLEEMKEFIKNCITAYKLFLKKRIGKDNMFLSTRIISDANEFREEMKKP